MDADERDICNYLRGWPGQFVSAREICRRAAGKRRYREEPNWAFPVLSRLVEQGRVESDATGHYRLRPREKKKPKRWLSPRIHQILKDSGKGFEEVISIEDESESEL
jgi:hypothetical protein